MYKKFYLISLLILLPTLALSTALAADLGVALKADKLLAEPFNDAKTVGNMLRGDNVEIITKKGPWLQIKAKKSTGWVRLLSVKRANSAVSNSKGILDVASGRVGTGQVVSTTGVRGLSAEELKSAKFSEEEVKAMESYTEGAEQGKNFANAAQLQVTKMSYFVNSAASTKGTK